MILASTYRGRKPSLAIGARTPGHERKGIKTMDNMKKNFQKVVKMFRDTLPDVQNYCSGKNEPETVRPEYPKAIMTAAQQRKGTATINCSYGKGAKETAEAMKSFIPFTLWCEAYGIKTVSVETVKSPYCSMMQYQIRVTY